MWRQRYIILHNPTKTSSLSRQSSPSKRTSMTKGGRSPIGNAHPCSVDYVLFKNLLLDYLSQVKTKRPPVYRLEPFSSKKFTS